MRTGEDLINYARQLEEAGLLQPEKKERTFMENIGDLLAGTGAGLLNFGNNAVSVIPTIYEIGRDAIFGDDGTDNAWLRGHKAVEEWINNDLFGMQDRTGWGGKFGQGIGSLVGSSILAGLTGGIAPALTGGVTLSNALGNLGKLAMLAGASEGLSEAAQSYRDTYYDPGNVTGTGDVAAANAIKTAMVNVPIGIATGWLGNAASNAASNGIAKILGNNLGNIVGGFAGRGLGEGTQEFLQSATSTYNSPYVYTDEDAQNVGKGIWANLVPTSLENVGSKLGQTLTGENLSNALEEGLYGFLTGGLAGGIDSGIARNRALRTAEGYQSDLANAMQNSASQLAERTGADISQLPISDFNTLQAQGDAKNLWQAIQEAKENKVTGENIMDELTKVLNISEEKRVNPDTGKKETIYIPQTYNDLAQRLGDIASDEQAITDYRKSVEDEKARVQAEEVRLQQEAEASKTLTKNDIANWTDRLNSGDATQEDVNKFMQWLNNTKGLLTDQRKTTGKEGLNQSGRSLLKKVDEAIQLTNDYSKQFGNNLAVSSTGNVVVNGVDDIGQFANPNEQTQTVTNQQKTTDGQPKNQTGTNAPDIATVPNNVTPPVTNGNNVVNNAEEGAADNNTQGEVATPDVSKINEFNSAEKSEGQPVQPVQPEVPPTEPQSGQQTGTDTEAKAPSNVLDDLRKAKYKKFSEKQLSKINDQKINSELTNEEIDNIIKNPGSKLRDLQYALKLADKSRSVAEQYIGDTDGEARKGFEAAINKANKQMSAIEQRLNGTPIEEVSKMLGGDNNEEANTTDIKQIDGKSNPIAKALNKNTLRTDEDYSKDTADRIPRDTNTDKDLRLKRPSFSIAPIMRRFSYLLRDNDIDFNKIDSDHVPIKIKNQLNSYTRNLFNALGEDTRVALDVREVAKMFGLDGDNSTYADLTNAIIDKALEKVTSQSGQETRVLERFNHITEDKGDGSYNLNDERAIQQKINEATGRNQKVSIHDVYRTANDLNKVSDLIGLRDAIFDKKGRIHKEITKFIKSESGVKNGISSKFADELNTRLDAVFKDLPNRLNTENNQNAAEISKEFSKLKNTKFKDFLSDYIKKHNLSAEDIDNLFETSLNLQDQYSEKMQALNVGQLRQNTDEYMNYATFDENGKLDTIGKTPWAVQIGTDSFGAPMYVMFGKSNDYNLRDSQIHGAYNESLSIPKHRHKAKVNSFSPRIGYDIPVLPTPDSQAVTRAETKEAQVANKGNGENTKLQEGWLENTEKRINALKEYMKTENWALDETGNDFKNNYGIAKKDYEVLEQVIRYFKSDKAINQAMQDKGYRQKVFDNGVFDRMAELAQNKVEETGKDIGARDYYELFGEAYRQIRAENKLEIPKLTIISGEESKAIKNNIIKRELDKEAQAKITEDIKKLFGKDSTAVFTKDGNNNNIVGVYNKGFTFYIRDSLADVALTKEQAEQLAKDHGLEGKEKEDFVKNPFKSLEALSRGAGKASNIINLSKGLMSKDNNLMHEAYHIYETMFSNSDEIKDIQKIKLTDSKISEKDASELRADAYQEYKKNPEAFYKKNAELAEAFATFDKRFLGIEPTMSSLDKKFADFIKKKISFFAKTFSDKSNVENPYNLNNMSLEEIKAMYHKLLGRTYLTPTQKSFMSNVETKYNEVVKSLEEKAKSQRENEEQAKQTTDSNKQAPDFDTDNPLDIKNMTQEQRKNKMSQIMPIQDKTPEQLAFIKKYQEIRKELKKSEKTDNTPKSKYSDEENKKFVETFGKYWDKLSDDDKDYILKDALDREQLLHAKPKNFHEAYKVYSRLANYIDRFEARIKYIGESKFMDGTKEIKSFERDIKTFRKRAESIREQKEFSEEFGDDDTTPRAQIGSDVNNGIDVRINPSGKITMATQPTVAENAQQIVKDFTTGDSTSKTKNAFNNFSSYASEILTGDKFKGLKQETKQVLYKMKYIDKNAAQGKADFNGLKSWEDIVKIANIKDGIKSAKYGDLGKYLSYSMLEDEARIGQKTPLSQKEYQDAINEYEREYPEFKEVKKYVKEHTDEILKNYLAAGMIDQQQYNAIKKKNFYAPLYNQADLNSDDSFYKVVSNSLSTKQMANHWGNGNMNEIINPLESLLKMEYKSYEAVERKNSINELLKIGEKDKGTGLDLFTVSDQKQGPLDVRFFENGKEKWLHSDNSYYLENFVSKPPSDIEKSMPFKIARNLASMVRKGYNSLPTRALTNLINDNFEAMTNVREYHPLTQCYASIMSVIKQDKNFIKAAKAGAFQGIGRDSLTKSHNDIESFMLNNEKVTPKNFLKKYLNSMDNLMEMSERSTRLGVFNALVKSGMSESDAAAKAVSLLNFSSGSDTIKFLNRYTPFLNSNIQGNVALARTFKADPFRATASAFMKYLPVVLGTYAFNHRDKESEEIYNELPQWRKDSYFNLVFNKNCVMSIPNGHLPGLVFHGLTERFVNWLHTGNKPEYKNIMNSMFGEVVPNVIPTAILGPLEIMHNKNFHTGKDIVPSSESKRYLPHDQYGAFTSGSAILMSKMLSNIGLEVSPRILEHIAKTYGGNLGKNALKAADYIESGGETDLPLVSDFVAKAQGGATEQEFMQELEDATAQYNSAKKAFDEKDYDDNDRRIVRSDKMLDSINRQFKKPIQTLNKEIREIEKNHRMSRAVKDRQISIREKKLKVISNRGLKMLRKITDKW